MNVEISELAMAKVSGSCSPSGSVGPVEDVHTWSCLAKAAATRFGTPCYLSRWAPVREMAESLERRLDATCVKSWLSFKTHPVRPLAEQWIRSGRGIEVVSEAEFVALRALRCPTEQLLVNGVAKHDWLRRYPVPSLRVHLDSLREVHDLASSAIAQHWRVGLRCHMPSERDARDHHFGGQFGLNLDETAAAHRQLKDHGVRVEGLHFHLGQSARAADAYSKSFEYIIAICRHLGLEPSYVDCGGGIDAGTDIEATIDDLAASIERMRRQLPTVSEVWLENGRYLTQGSAALVMRVLDVKNRPESRYLICDGGRTNQALAADNGPHPILLLPHRTGPVVLTTICGPTCMTDDRLPRLMLPDTIVSGDFIVWLNAGAYHLPWETRFSHGLCAVVWSDEHERLSLARARESPEEWGYLWTAQ